MRTGVRSSPEFGFWVSGFGFRVSDFRFRVSVIVFWSVAFRRAWVWGSGFRISGVGCWISCFGFRVSGFGFRVSGCRFRISAGIALRKVATTGRNRVSVGFGVAHFGFWVLLAGLLSRLGERRRMKP